MKLTFIEQPEFSTVRDELFGTEGVSSNFRRLQSALMRDPRAGSVIPGAGGARKVRWMRAGRTGGKSGGIRVIYYYNEQKSRILLLRTYAKNQQDDLTSQQARQISGEIDIERSSS